MTDPVAARDGYAPFGVCAAGAAARHSAPPAMCGLPIAWVRPTSPGMGALSRQRSPAPAVASTIVRARAIHDPATTPTPRAITRQEVLTRSDMSPLGCSVGTRRRACGRGVGPPSVGIARPGPDGLPGQRWPRRRRAELRSGHSRMWLATSRSNRLPFGVNSSHPHVHWAPHFAIRPRNIEIRRSRSRRPAGVTTRSSRCGSTGPPGCGMSYR